MRTSLLLFLSAICLSANAQKLPNVQQVSLRAPANVKIDGKATEWGNKFRAYNKATDIFYSIANNADNIYMLVQARDIVAIQKIASGGLTVTINTSGQNKADGAVSITYPVHTSDEKPAYLTVMNKPQQQKDTAAYRLQIDNFKNAGNKLLANSAKFIGVSGFKTITDEKLPIYNAEGIVVGALFNSALYYTFELAIPLKLLKSDKALSKIAYNIRVNGITNNNTNLQAIARNGFYIMTYKGTDGKNYALDSAAPGLVAPTDFWGEYSLAK